MYGLKGSSWEQYVAFWGRLFRGDLGPSFSTFPTPVTTLIAQAMPWTLGLLLTAVLISWVLGNVLGAFASYYPKSRIMGVIDVLSQAVRPIPYYVMALVMLIMFAYVIKIFPFSGAYPAGTRVQLTPQFMLTVVKHSALPALSLVTLGMGGWFLGMKSLTSNIISEDYVVYAETAGCARTRSSSTTSCATPFCRRSPGWGCNSARSFPARSSWRWSLATPGWACSPCRQSWGTTIV